MKDSTSKRCILAVDDDDITQIFLKRRFAGSEYDLHTVSTAEAAFHRLQNNPGYDLILCDLKMPKMDGIQFLSELKRKNYDVPLILMTAHGSLETAIHAMREGAFDYILKPINLDELRFSLEKAFKIQKLEKDNWVLRKQLKQTWENNQIIGKSSVILSMFDLIERVAPTHANVLIHGESGTGKELVARALHYQSPRKDQPFVAINCSAIPSELLESELFGHAKGSFTGAHQAKKGLFEEANRGTLFLDEIGDMELSLQAKLLRVIQERKIRPVGDNTDRSIDVRLVAATHKNLRKACESHQFRDDLYYRLCVIPIEIPSLRQRKEDIPLLANYFLKKHAQAHLLTVEGFTAQAMSKLIHYNWPGNVRELENMIERSLILARSNQISEDDIAFPVSQSDLHELVEEKASKMMSLDEVEKHYISLILHKMEGKKERASQVLGIDRKTLRRKIRDYGLGMDAESESVSELENILN